MKHLLVKLTSYSTLKGLSRDLSHSSTLLKDFNDLKSVVIRVIP